MITGRASTLEAKREILARLLVAWERVPDQRLGQLLINAMNKEALAGAVGMFGVEDAPLLAMIERFVAPAGAICGARDPACPQGRTCTGAATRKGHHVSGAARWVR